jgi:DNA-directed RNA polymerase specialized sigma24 family protein
LLSALHERIVCGDAAARNELLEVLTPRTEQYLRRLRFRGSNGDLVHDAAVDALMDYIAAPHRFDPGKCPLRKFIELAGRRNLLNALRAERRLAARHAALAHVVVTMIDYSARPYFLSRSCLHTVLKGFSRDELQVLKLWLDGERATTAFAQALSLCHLAREEQRQIVRRMKERVVRRLHRCETPHSTGPGNS